MKHIQKLCKMFTLAAILTGLSACSKSDLELKNPNDVTLNNFWTSEAEAKIGLAGVFDAYQHNLLVGQRYRRFDVATDNLQSVNQTGLNEVETSTHNSAIAYIGDFWAHSYNVVQRANLVIKNVNEMSSSIISDASKKRIVADASFLRAHAYLDLTSLYGDIPFYIEPVDPFDEGLGKTPKAEIYAFLINDLTTNVIPNLPQKVAASENGRISSGAARALLGKYYLYAQDWPKAAAEFKTIIDSKVYSLFPSYSRLFTLEGEYSTESLFEIGYIDGSVDGGESFSQQVDTTLAPVYPNAFMRPTDNLVNSYPAIDGRPITGPDASPLYNAARRFENRDPRLRASIYTNLDVSPTGKKYWNYSNATSLAVRKYTWYVNNVQYQQGPQNYYMIRYADVLLMYAEAKNEATGVDASVYSSVTDIRKRAGILPGTNNLYGLKANMSQTEMRNVIRNERRWEFAFEHQRYFDLKRWGIIATVINSITPNPRPKAFTAPRDLLWPYPQAEFFNNPKLRSEGQNPGWE